ncbi:uncharacterized protein LOC127867728 isoform X1 [Dreissena polymorpha]|uniref:uncharacterized protein LOC127867728 isoform X1 n=1 Tax=Dreissena polymorpha TaxID=45954 RepID=UPI002263C184|nr:uncharacterized protein LOC127867728 isoform X1 [Dreissena polymorpha]
MFKVAGCFSSIENEDENTQVEVSLAIIELEDANMKVSLTEDTAGVSDVETGPPKMNQEDVDDTTEQSPMVGIHEQTQRYSKDSTENWISLQMRMSDIKPWVETSGKEQTITTRNPIAVWLADSEYRCRPLSKTVQP